MVTYIRRINNFGSLFNQELKLACPNGRTKMKFFVKNCFTYSNKYLEWLCSLGCVLKLIFYFPNNKKTKPSLIVGASSKINNVATFRMEKMIKNRRSRTKATNVQLVSSYYQKWVLIKKFTQTHTYLTFLFHLNKMISNKPNLNDFFGNLIFFEMIKEKLWLEDLW